MEEPAMLRRDGPFYSILTASLNQAATLPKTLASIEQQVCQDFEHIVIDGGSTDHSVVVLSDFQGRYGLQWISESDRGIADALNKGIQLSRGRYLLVLHANDQLLNPSILQSVYQVVSKEEIDIISFPVWKEKQCGRFFLYRPIKMVWWYHFKTIIPHQGAFVHRRVFNKIGTFRTVFSIAFDYDFFYRALGSGFSVRFGNQPVSVMRGVGISSDQAMLKKRLFEESLVQKTNEKSMFWRLNQRLFQWVYFTYKTHIAL